MASEDAILDIDGAGEDGSGNRRLLGVIALVAIIFIALWLFLSQTANVPDVAGMQESEARAVIAEAGFVVGDIETISTTETPSGAVATQAPAGGARALKGAQIDLTVADDGTGTGGDEGSGSAGDEELGGDTGPEFSSNGTATVDMTDGYSGDAIEYGPQVPQVLGMSEAKAVATLKAAGYYPVIAGRGPSTTTVAAGLVYYQNPPPEAFEPRGKTIEIWISTGTLDHGVPYPKPE